MAESEFARIVAEAAEHWPDVSVAVEHRLGRVPIGQASIAIAAAAPHRAEAFEACRFLIDETKIRVPIWKREFLESGDARWRSNEETNLED
jgi:molybdopterin synthase catalytic subunit